MRVVDKQPAGLKSRMEDRRGTLAIPDVVLRVPAPAPGPAVAQRSAPRPVVLRSECPGARQRRLLRIELATLAGAFAMPLVLWHESFEAIAAAFGWNPGYFVGVTPMILMALGILCYLPVVAHRARPPHADRFHRPQPGSWQAWAICLYLLGFVLASQVAQLTQGVGAP